MWACSIGDVLACCVGAEVVTWSKVADSEAAAIRKVYSE